ncbi:MAG: sodium/proton-translocating pyrophosphatase, partial [Methylococcus sp.]|nr:sodium/proton-translocating pyrophosphatase [Methylococcus sp.]
MNVSNIELAALASGAAGILFALVSAGGMARKSVGSPEIQVVMKAIREGTRAFLKRQYATVAIVASVLALVLTQLGTWTANGFIVGVVASALAGYVGMVTAVGANARTAEAARNGLGAALSTAFRSGTVTGLLVGGLALSTVAGYYALTSAVASLDAVPGALLGLALGGSLMSVFARVTGGVCGQAAAVGAGMVEGADTVVRRSDPNNAATVADYVGANIGHAAGMAADLYETYTLALVAAMLLAKGAFGADSPWIEFPLLIASLALVASLAGICFVRLGKSRYVMGALYRSVIVTVILAGVGLYYASEWFVGLPGVQPAFSVLSLFAVACVGLVLAGSNIAAAEYLTSKSFSAVRRIAAASRDGHATNVIAGLAAGLKSTALPIIVLCAAFAGPYYLGGGFAGHASTGLFAVGLAAVAMSSLGSLMVAIDGYSVVATAAHGIAEMADLPEEVRQSTASLDAAGHTTRAVVQGYAIGAGGLAVLALFAEYSRSFGVPLAIDLSSPVVLISLFVGGLLPYLFGALALVAVGCAAALLAKEANRQLGAVGGFGSMAAPQYGRCMDVAVRSAIRRTMLLVLLPLSIPLAVGLMGEIG